MVYSPFCLVSGWFFVAFVDVRIVLLDHAFINDEGLGCIDNHSEDSDRNLYHNNLHNVDIVTDTCQGGLNQQNGRVCCEQALTEEVGNVVVFAVQSLDGFFVLRAIS